MPPSTPLLPEPRLAPGVYVAYVTPVLPFAALGVDATLGTAGSCPNSEMVGLGCKLPPPPPPAAGRGGSLGVDEPALAELVDEALPLREGTCGGGASDDAVDRIEAGVLERSMTACANMSSSALVSSMCCEVDAGLSVLCGSCPNKP